MVESPSLGMVFFFVLLAWAGRSWTERDGTDACMHACTHNMTDSMFRMGIDGCVPENFMENEQNMALALFFLLFKDTHTPTHHLVVSSSSSSLGLLCFLFLDWEMGCLITRSSVELKLLLSCHRRGDGER